MKPPWPFVESFWANFGITLLWLVVKIGPNFWGPPSDPSEKFPCLRPQSVYDRWTGWNHPSWATKLTRTASWRLSPCARSYPQKNLTFASQDPILESLAVHTHSSTIGLPLACADFLPFEFELLKTTFSFQFRQLRSKSPSFHYDFALKAVLCRFVGRLEPRLGAEIRKPCAINWVSWRLFGAIWSVFRVHSPWLSSFGFFIS